MAASPKHSSLASPALPSRDAFFVFKNKRNNRSKLPYFYGTGLWLATKRIEKDRLSCHPANRVIAATSSSPGRCRFS
jgi:hypothetical protein